jgi:hypothetical protein
MMHPTGVDYRRRAEGAATAGAAGGTIPEVNVMRGVAHGLLNRVNY